VPVSECFAVSDVFFDSFSPSCHRMLADASVCDSCPVLLVDAASDVICIFVLHSIVVSVFFPIFELFLLFSNLLYFVSFCFVMVSFCADCPGSFLRCSTVMQSCISILMLFPDPLLPTAAWP